MITKTIENLNQMPRGDYEAVTDPDPAKALAALEAIAWRKGETLGTVYQFGDVLFYATVEKEGTK